MPNLLAWGSAVSPEFRDKVRSLCQDLALDPDDLMAVMAFETGRTFSASVRNAAGSGAVGLIQFMPQTAAQLGTTTEELAAMTAVEQLEDVRLYLIALAHRVKNLGDLYLAVLWPAGVGKPDSYVLFDQAGPHPKQYLENRGLDFNHDGKVTRADAIRPVQLMLIEGLKHLG